MVYELYLNKVIFKNKKLHLKNILLILIFYREKAPNKEILKWDMEFTLFLSY